MANKKKEQEVIESVTQDQKVESTQVDDKIKIKKNKLNVKNDDEVFKVDLKEVNKPQEEVIDNKEDISKEQTIENVSTQQEQEVVSEITEKSETNDNTESSTEQEDKEQVPENEQNSVLEEITNEEVSEDVEDLKEEINEAVEQEKQTGAELPENIQKVIDFMNETGGSLEEYVKLNQDYSGLDDKFLLAEYYRQTRPHLNNDEINFLLEDSFSYDEDVDEDRDIKRKKLAFKEQVANARVHLDGLKSKYYEEIKMGSKLAPEQQKAVDFFNRYNKETEQSQKIAEKQKSLFVNKTDQVFNDQFKGFEYEVGEKKYRFNVKEADKVKKTQSDINNFVKKFLNEKNEIVDAKGYHKSLFTAMNADSIANHFYEQGKADAIKQSVAKSKNIDMNPRQGHEGFVDAGGVKIRALSGDSSSSLKFKVKK
tara:strand:+ start:877 stop:2151 length:1275 start_codon:yes stop_codon:yes gene_type:complete